jgi:hypothetical protein
MNMDLWVCHRQYLTSFQLRFSIYLVMHRLMGPFSAEASLGL